MGLDASRSLKAAVESSCVEELEEALATCTEADRVRLAAVVNASGADGSLAGVANLRDAVRRGGDAYWDFASSQAKRASRTWHDHLPMDLHGEVTRDLTEEELHQIRTAAAIDQVRPVATCDQPRAIICMGPAAAGKTTALPKAAALFGLDLKDFVHIDGDDIREAHGGWKATTGDQANGYKDVYDIFVKNKKTKDMKNFLAKKAIMSRKNVVFGWTSIEKEALQMLKDQQYCVYVLGLLISLAESNARQLNRAQVNGRWASWPEEKVCQLLSPSSKAPMY